MGSRADSEDNAGISAVAVLDAMERMSSIGHWTYDLRSSRVRWSERVYTIYDYEPFSVEPSYERAAEVFKGEARKAFEAKVGSAMQTGAPYKVQLPMTTHLGTERVVVAAGEARTDQETGEVTHLYGLVEDVTDVSRNHDHLRRIEEVVHTMREGVLITDRKGNIVWTNEAFQRLSGFTPDEVLGKRPGDLLQGPGTDPRTVEDMRHKVRAGEGFTTEILNYSKFGDPYWLKLSVVPRLNEQGEVIEFFGLEIDITEQRESQTLLEKQRSEMELANFKLARQQRELRRVAENQQQTMAKLQAEIDRGKALEAELRRMATTDALCEVANRRYLLEQAEMETQRCKSSSRPLSVLCLDIDHFKAVNDRHGHAAGDRVLQAVARALVETVRPQVDLVARVGGEEFVILLPGTTFEEAQLQAERVRQSVQAASTATTASGGSLSVTCSIGVASLDTKESFSSLLNRGDRALYRAKEQGRNRVRTQSLHVKAANDG